MLKYFKDAFTNYENAGILQTLSLLLFVIFFLGLIYFIWKRPKEYYKDDANRPLDDDEIDKTK
ncbi:cbb3-type cytochrome oxidase subunit 3 [Moheibacter sp.]|uniref:cbb3-type cytochrome oxidase subunit 3 n=1 Tax=Moheibacter sp. TaxID=1965316 RepID=UPI003C792BF5